MSRQSINDILPPGPRPLPIFGNMLAFRRNPLAFVTQLQRTYGPAATFYMGRVPIFLLSRPETIHYILVEQARNFTNREFAFELTELLGNGLLTIDGDFHRQQRRLVQPAFHKRRVESYRDLMVAHTEAMLAEWRPGMEVDIQQEMQRLTLRIVAQALFSMDAAASDRFGAIFNQVTRISRRRRYRLFRNLNINLPFTAYGRYLRLRQQLDRIVYQIIAQRRAAGIDNGDVISMLLHAQDTDGTTLTDRQIRDHTMTLIAAGHETTALTLTWAFYLLSQHPHVRARLVTELDTILGGRAPTVADLEHLPYLEMVIAETQRLYPPAWTEGRRAINAFTADGYTFPAGSMIMLSQWVTHRAPAYFPDPEQFRPERFDPATGDPHPLAFFPFGGGPRTCIGMPFALLEARVLLATIIQRFSPTLVPGQRVEPLPMVTLRPKYGMRMRLELTPHPAPEPAPAPARRDSA
jgi:cytochrome P450